jgi:hypothetical protein
MLSGETDAVYCENHMEHTNTLRVCEREREKESEKLVVESESESLYD